MDENVFVGSHGCQCLNFSHTVHLLLRAAREHALSINIALLTCCLARKFGASLRYQKACVPSLCEHTHAERTAYYGRVDLREGVADQRALQKVFALEQDPHSHEEAPG